MFDPSAKELHDGQCRHKLHLFHKYHMLHCCYMPNAAQSGVPGGAPSFLGILEYIPGCTVQGPEFQHRLQESQLVGLTVSDSASGIFGPLAELSSLTQLDISIHFEFCGI